ncbi:MAG: NAD(P)/FAD-dependent oxidoreductase [Planctomycetaceae bacterium]
MAKTDAVVIGAGVHGAAAAFHLARRGASVTIVERTTAPAGGPTGRSSAICRAYYTNEFLATCARDSIAMLERFQALTGVDAGFRRTGFVYLHPPEDDASVRASVERLRALGLDVAVLGPEGVAERASGFDLGDVGVVAFEANAGYADPHATTDGLVRGAIAAGADPRFGHTVTALASEDDGCVVTLDDGERLDARSVLVAAGPWTGPLLARIGVNLPLRVERHVVATFAWGAAEPVPAHGDLAAGAYYFRPEGEELFLMGPVLPEPKADPDDFDERIRPEEVERLASAATRRVPRLERAEARGGWASLYDVSPDWQPVIGRVAPGVFVDAGTSGHGFKLAPALGGHVAAMVLGDDVPSGLAAFDPFRFAAGHALSAGYGEARILG